MTTMSKFLALIPVVGFVAACSGVAPTGPNPVASNDATEISGNASTLSRSDCFKGLVGVNLSINDSERSMRWVEATYHFSGNAPVKCAAPEWKSNRFEMIVDRNNPFRAGFLRTASGVATVSATAANGVNAEIQVKLGGPSNSLIDPIQCPNVVGVAVTVDPSSDDTRVQMGASYVYDGPFSTPCSIVPTWSADRRGLSVNPKNPFKASIGMSDAKTIVTVLGPHGTSGDVTF